jgi:hypothetical protein
MMCGIHTALQKSQCFEPIALPQFGNIIMFRVVPPYDLGGEAAYFLKSLIGANVTSLTGSCFGLGFDGSVWARVVVGGASLLQTCNALARLETFLEVTATAKST